MEKKKKKVASDQKNVLGACASARRLHAAVLGAVMRILVELELTRLLWPGAHSN